MSAGGPNSVAISRQSARYVVALGLVLLSVTVAGAALGGVTAAESQSSPIEVSDWTDLDDIRNDLDADYVLVNDLNETTPGYDTVAGPNADGGNGFAPIGGFNASFDGQGNRIANLTIDRPSENGVGLFGGTSESAVIEEVILTGATVTGSSDIGGLVGVNDGTVSNSSASGNVTGFSDVGGLIGSNSGTVSNSAASGNVTGSETVGGLVGEIFEGTVSESFATGAVTGSTVVGGLIGAGGTVTESYWDVQATGQSQSAGGIGLSTSQMQGTSAAQNMGALDFTNTWRVVTNPPGYPELRSLSDGPEPPLTAGFTIAPEDPTVGEQLIFDADPSMPESDIQSYDWTLGDGTTATGEQVTHTYTDSGQFTVELTIQSDTETDTTTETVSVSPPADTFGIESITPYVGGTAVEEYTHVEDLNTSLSYRVRVTQPSATANVTFELGSTTYTDTDGSDGWQFPVPTAQLTSDETLLVTAYGTDGASAVDSISVPVVETPAWFDLLDPISRFEDKPIVELQAEFPSGGGSPIQLPNQFPFADNVSLPVVGSSQSSDLTATVTVRVNLRTAEATSLRSVLTTTSLRTTLKTYSNPM